MKNLIIGIIIGIAIFFSARTVLADQRFWVNNVAINTPDNGADDMTVIDDTQNKISCYYLDSRMNQPFLQCIKVK
jgi:hypothetical protein